MITQQLLSAISHVTTNECDGGHAEDRVALALEEYAAAADAGQPISKYSLLAKYVDVADELAGCLDSLDFIHQVAPQLNGGVTLTDNSSGNEIRPLAMLGDFRIVREIGRGGMGVVYEAEQLSLGRKVALKVLPFAAMLDKQQLKRFKNEARAAATLDHPNIVAIYSVGEERGVHYYAMQLVEGQSLAEVIEQLQRKLLVSGQLSVAKTADFHATDNGPRTTDTVPVAALSTLPDFDSREYYRTVARLGIQAAEALDHAHQQGVIHRDIKPGNLLVDDTGKLWITDFGLARIEADAGMTMTGDLVGTLRYMSPEQALANRAAVDHRTDIYSLGVTVYELLTMQPAFAGNDRQELLKKIAFNEPRRLRQINPRIPQDLETIVLKAIEKNPADRYATAQQIAEDLLRFLSDKPIEAHRPSLPVILGKWLRRHHSLVTSICMSCAALLIMGQVMLTISNTRIRKEAATSATALKEKNAALIAARKAVDGMLVRVSEYQLKDVPSASQIRLALMEDALSFYESLLDQERSDPNFRKEMAQALSSIAYIQRQLGNRHEEKRSLERSIESWRELVDADPNDPERLESLAACERALAYTLTAIRPPDNELAELHYRNALKAYETLKRKWPGRPSGTALCLNYFASRAKSRGDRAEAERLWRESIRQNEEYLGLAQEMAASDQHRKLANEHKPDLNLKFANFEGVRCEICWACVGVAGILNDFRAAEAEPFVTKGLGHAALLLMESPHSVAGREITAALHLEMAMVLCRTGRAGGALKILRQAADESEALCQDFPRRQESWRTAENVHRLGILVLREAGRLDDAKQFFDRTRQWLENSAALVSDEAEQRSELDGMLKRINALRHDLDENDVIESEVLSATDKD